MTLFLATRPAFLTVTLLAVALGLAFAWSTGAPPNLTESLLTLTGAVLAHAGANVFNDVHDAKNGSDDCNTERIAPFTGGSRFIQNGTLSVETMTRLAWSLLASSALIGWVLLMLTDNRLLVYGGLGLLLAVAYSAPPLALMSHGWGEIAVGAGWVLIIAGTDFVARQTFFPAVLWVALPFGLQAMLILLNNQIPDFNADLTVGKRNWVVRWGRHRASRIYVALHIVCYLIVTLGVLLSKLPTGALSSFLAFPFGLVAARFIEQYETNPTKLRSSIILTLVSAHLFGALLVASLIAHPLMKGTP